VALAVLKKLVARGDIAGHERVVVISTANGLKFTDFKIGYHDEHLPGITSHLANHPMELPNQYAAVVDALVRKTAGGTRQAAGR
jgi:threonine synthase